MNCSEKKAVRIAILDMNEGKPNQGMRCIREILNQFGDAANIDLDWDEFEVRLEKKVPSLDYDIYISSGGPGSPLESEGNDWENVYFGWLNKVMLYNANDAHVQKKKVFFICHSYQLACRYLKLPQFAKEKAPLLVCSPCIHCPLQQMSPYLMVYAIHFMRLTAGTSRLLRPIITNCTKWVQAF